MANRYIRHVEKIECESCGKTFKRRKFRHARFCSHKCANQRDNPSRFKPGYNYKEKFGIEKAEKMIKQSSERIKFLHKNKLIKYGNKHSEETKKKIGRSNSISLRGNKQTPETIKKRLTKREMSSLEIKMLNIIKKHSLPYKFVGNGQFFIENKNPDFINCNGEKIAIEVFYRDHKNKFRNGCDSWKAERQKIFNKYGWEIMFFNETEVNEENILNQIGRRLIS